MWASLQWQRRWGSHEGCGKALVSGAIQLMFNAAEKLLATGVFERQCSLAEVVGSDRVADFYSMWVLLFLRSPRSSYLSFFLCYLLLLLPPWLLPAPAPLVRSEPGQTVGIDWHGLWCTLELILFLLSHVYLSSWELMGWKDAHIYAIKIITVKYLFKCL